MRAPEALLLADPEEVEEMIDEILEADRMTAAQTGYQANRREFGMKTRRMSILWTKPKTLKTLMR